MIIIDILLTLMIGLLGIMIRSQLKINKQLGKLEMNQKHIWKEIEDIKNRED